MTRRSTLTFTISAALLVMAAQAFGQVRLQHSQQIAAAGWPQWRGPGRNGLAERSPALVNSLAGQSPLWQSEAIASGEVGGRGSLVVRPGRVYGLTTIQSSDKPFDEVFCLDADNGKTVWRSELAQSRSPEGGSATPCIVGDRLYVVGSGGKVHCLNVSSGSPVWDAALSPPPGNAVASSVAVAEGVAVLLADKLTGLNAETGHVLWTQAEIAGHESSPAVWNTSGREYILCNTNLETHCVDPTSGEIVWSVPGGGKSTPVVAQEYGGDFLVNMSDSRKSGLSAFRLTRDGPQKLWTLRASDRASSPVVFDGHVYAIAGGGSGHGARLLCVHLDTGQVAWDATIDFAEVSSPLIADGKLITVCGTLLWLLQATPENYSVLSQTDCRITLCTSPAILDGRLYLRQANAVVCYDLRSAP